MRSALYIVHSVAPGPCHFNKEQTPLASLRYQPAVSRRLFRCLGVHLLTKPLNCKFVSRTPATRSIVHGHTTSVTSQCSSLPSSICRQMTSSRCRGNHVHPPTQSCFGGQAYCLSFVHSYSHRQHRRENKKPCLRFVSRVLESLFRFLTCLHPAYPSYLWVFAR